MDNDYLLFVRFAWLNSRAIVISRFQHRLMVFLSCTVGSFAVVLATASVLAGVFRTIVVFLTSLADSFWGRGPVSAEDTGETFPCEVGAAIAAGIKQEPITNELTASQPIVLVFIAFLME